MSTTSQANERRPLQAKGDLIVAEEISADDQNDIDSIFSESASSTTSIAPSILEYRRIHGRTYHSDTFTTNYFLPNDEQQLASEEIRHHYLTILLNDQLFLAPLEKERIHRVLDVGTGSGIWAIEFADRFPNASVTGTDISPCQPQWVPPNVSFEVDDASLEWTWDANHFDFIHMRYISVELDAHFRGDDGSTELEPVLASYGDLFQEGGKIMNRHFFVHEIQPQAFDEAGFVNKRVVRYKVPVGPWARDPKLAEVGRFLRAALENDLQGYTQMVWHNVLQRPTDEYNVWLADLRKAIRNSKVHSYMTVHIVYGRKPS